jgi:demethylmenaquinone methyltransferase/2-methoxy-6-polyprenyl-1,4-benzoquinol methylase
MDTINDNRQSPDFAGQVNRMFDRVAGRYDALNSLMTAGLHHRWRERAAAQAELGPGDTALDVCCGTGDLALELANQVTPGGHVVGCDFSEPMLDLAREKAVERGADGVRFEWADALQLPGLREMARVLKPGGRAVILEITQPTRPPLSLFYSLWFDRVVPLLGAFSSNPEAYSYLPESVRSFPSPRGLAEKMDAAGFERVRYTVLAGGIIAIHSGTRG